MSVPAAAGGFWGEAAVTATSALIVMSAANTDFINPPVLVRSHLCPTREVATYQSLDDHERCNRITAALPRLSLLVAGFDARVLSVRSFSEQECRVDPLEQHGKRRLLQSRRT